MRIQPRLLHAHCNNGYRYIKEKWSKPAGRPDGLLVISDVVFKGVWYAIMELGIKIPEELALVAHTNKGLRPMMHIPLTALEIDPEEIARTSMDAFLARLEGQKPRAQKVKAKLIKGVTC
jgi:DNA-binding LacI/PurR family transcriptional regulator